MDGIWNDLIGGKITAVTMIVWFTVAIILGAGGGAIGGMLVGAQHLGKELSAMIGGFYGPVSAAPGVLLGLIILTFL